MELSESEYSSKTSLTSDSKPVENQDTVNTHIDSQLLLMKQDSRQVDSSNLAPKNKMNRSAFLLIYGPQKMMKTKLVIESPEKVSAFKQIMRSTPKKPKSR